MKHMIAATLALLAAPVQAACIPVSPGLPGWERLDFDDIAPNTWSGDGGTLAVASSSSASMLYTTAPGAAGPILTWRWRVDTAAPATDLGRKGGDDRSLALTIGFAYDSANASLGERMKRVVVETVAGADAPGRIVDFVQGGTQPAGTRIESPYSGRASQMIIQHPATATTGQWQSERVDLAALYRELWGNAMPAITRVAVFADTDDTGATARSVIADICFSDA